MQQVLGILDNAILQGTTYGIAVIGVVLAFRVLRYPDLTPDGSFLLGGAAAASVISAGGHWFFALLIAIGLGAFAGVVTALLNVWAGVTRLLTGILTSMGAYSIAFHVLGGKSSVGILGQSTLFTEAERVDQSLAFAQSAFHPVTISTAILLVGAIGVFSSRVLSSDGGLVLRATGAHPKFVEGLGRRPKVFIVVGLASANALVGLSGAVVVSRQGFADVNMGAGMIVIFIAAMVIGEAALRRAKIDVTRSLHGRVFSAPLGTMLYFLFYLAVLRASILGLLPFRLQPTDLKLLSAAVVVLAIVLRRRGALRGDTEEILPL